MTDREVMKQALLALEGWDNYGKWAWPDTALEQSKRNTTESLASLRAALEQPEQNPVALIRDGVLRWHIPHEHYARPAWTAHGTHMLYAQPQPPRKPLTDEDIEQAQRTVWRSLPSDFDYTTSSWIEIGIRYAEAAHGIGEKP